MIQSWWGRPGEDKTFVLSDIWKKKLAAKKNENILIMKFQFANKMMKKFNKVIFQLWNIKFLLWQNEIKKFLGGKKTF